jgi:hypothetical protein
MKYVLGRAETDNRNIYRLEIGVLTVTILIFAYDEQYV